MAVVSFEITDHSGCVEGHSGGLACERDRAPYGDWASFGLFAEDSSAVLLRDLAAIGGLVTLLVLRRPMTIPARWSGKLATVFQFAALAAILVESPATRALVVLTAVVSVVAVVDYAREALRRIRVASPRSD